jgi:hypothetical protein
MSLYVHTFTRAATIALVWLVSMTSLASAQRPSSSSDSSRSAAGQELAEVERAINAVLQHKPVDNAAYSALIDRARARVQTMIAADALRTPSDFFVASLLSTDLTGFYESRRVSHELALMSLVLGHPDALKRVALTWDGLNLSLGAGQRIGSYKRNGTPIDVDPVPAPALIRELFADPAAARRRAESRANNAELQTLRDADQADREDPIDRAKMERMTVNDPLRRERTLRLIAEGVPVTGRDFHNAATVLQHGQSPNDFKLAHELTIAALALGDSSAVEMLARSYDRLLLRLGHRQRMNTQYGGVTGGLLPLDSTGVNDRIRVALGSRRLADAGRPPGAR